MSITSILMETVGSKIRKRREELGLLLRHVAAYVDIDQAILSKIERNERNPTRANIIKISEILKIDYEELLIQFMSDKIVHEIAKEKCAGKVLKVAERKIKIIQNNQINLK